MTEATATRTDDLFKPGDLVNNTYRIEAVLGRGGTSTVYRARSEISGRLMALKVLRSEFASNVDYLALLTREEEMRDIRHEAVVRYSETSKTADGHVYLLMDYVDGPGLDQKLKEAPVPAADLLTICRRVASGLQAAHDHRIVHRDLSPDNIILKEGDPGQAMIIDFGIAKDTKPGAETIVGNDFAGKYAYAAPEQLAGKTDARTDIYSLGALLLACFRGAPPDIGRNPMEVVEKKSKPLDLSGVPEPLRGLIARMTEPDPGQRFQSAAELIAAIEAGGAAAPPRPDEAESDGDRTIITPAAARQRDEAPPEIAGVAPAPAAKATKATTAQRGSRVPLLIAGIVALAVAIGAGLWATGMLTGPSYPEAAPFDLRLTREEGAPLVAAGFVPGPETQAALEDRAESDGGTADLTLASGDIGETWGDDVLALLGLVDPLDSFTIALSGNAARITGTTSDRQTAESVRAALAPGLPGVLQGAADIAYTPPFLPVEPLRAILRDFADCGPLALADPPPTGYGPDTAVRVTGRLASPETREALAGTLESAASPRPVAIEAEVLNPSLCLIEAALPDAPSSEIGFQFFEGSAPGGPDAGDIFLVGENPVIDVMLPAGVTEGFLAVSFLDVSGNVYHLLPNRARPDNSLTALREGEEGEVAVRVAYSIEAAEGTDRLAFRVDDRALGMSKILAIHSDAPLFTDLRPTTESASGYAQALSDGQRNPDARILSLDSRVMVTSER